jgi:hypothetical protein
MVPPSVITGAVVGGLYGAMDASSNGVSYLPEIAGWSIPFLILGAGLGLVLHVIFFKKK